jgi:hypothetical protein
MQDTRDIVPIGVISMTECPRALERRSRSPVSLLLLTLHTSSDARRQRCARKARKERCRRRCGQVLEAQSTHSLAGIAKMLRYLSQMWQKQRCGPPLQTGAPSQTETVALSTQKDMASVCLSWARGQEVDEANRRLCEPWADIRADVHVSATPEKPINFSMTVRLTPALLRHRWSFEQMKNVCALRGPSRNPQKLRAARLRPRSNTSQPKTVHLCRGHIL